MGKNDFGKLAGAGGAVAALGGAYKLGEFLYKAKRLRDVGPANAVYVRIIGRVQSVRARSFQLRATCTNHNNVRTSTKFDACSP